MIDERIRNAVQIDCIMENLLEGKRIFLTGGSRGLGRAMCEEFARQGANVAFNFSKDREGAEKTLSLIKEYGVEGYSHQVSVLDKDGLEDVSEELDEKWGGIDILVNNAGKSQPLQFALLEEEDWDDVIDTNLKGQYITTRVFLKGMIRKKEGVILNISSLAGTRMVSAPAHYSTSKAGVKGFSEALCKELGQYGIRINCIAPGLLETGVSQNLPEHKSEQYENHTALHRKGTTKEVAEFAAFVVSDRNSYMNGTTIRVDGGF